MKISRKQAELLAREVSKKLKESNVSEVSEDTKFKLGEFVDKYNSLKDKERKAREELQKHENTLSKLTGNCNRVYSYHSLPEMLQKLKEANTPKLEEIEDKIILGAMFSNEEDMETFVNRIASEFTKKSKRKISQN